MRKKGLVILGLIALIAVAATLLWAAPSYASKLSEALAKTPQGAGPGMIHPGAPQGLYGDSRGPAPFLPVLHLMGHLGRLDLLVSGRLRRHHGWAWAISASSGCRITPAILKIPAPA